MGVSFPGATAFAAPRSHIRVKDGAPAAAPTAVLDMHRHGTLQFSALKQLPEWRTSTSRGRQTTKSAISPSTERTFAHALL
jgi:hypothetical protein